MVVDGLVVDVVWVLVLFGCVSFVCVLLLFGCSCDLVGCCFVVGVLFGWCCLAVGVVRPLVLVGCCQLAAGVVLFSLFDFGIV